MKKILRLISIIIVTFVFTGQAQAARLFFEAGKSEVGVGQEMEVILRLDTEEEIINAIEGEISLPEIISVKSIRDGNSIIALWTERPEISDNSTIIFSGIIPGGRQTSDGEIFSLIIKTNTEGSGAISWSSARVLLHDGKGTKTEVRREALALRVDEAISITDFTVEADLEPPEEFKLYLADDKHVFSGDYFLVFTSQDKGSGIDYYEVQETKQKLSDEKMGQWQITKSPYRIKDQTLEHFIYVRAVDRAGNTRVSIFEPPEKETKPIDYRFIALVFLAFLVLVVIIVLEFKKRKTHKSQGE